jgi:AcrR family transcriptional regulator
MSLLNQKMATRREQILETARGLIESKGYEGLTMRNLAAKSGVTVPTIYNLIGNKEEVLFATVEDQTRSWVANLERVEADLTTVVEATVRQLVRRPRYYRALLMVLTNGERADNARRHVGRAVAVLIDKSLSRLAADGELAGWVDRDALAQRLHAHLDMASLEWARGTLTASSFRAAALFDMATTMLGLSSKTSRAKFEQLIREHQTDAVRRPRRMGVGESGHAA